MNFLCLSINFIALFAASAFVAAAELKVRNSAIVQFKELVVEPSLNGCYALVIGDANAKGRIPTITVKESEVLNFEKNSETFSAVDYFRFVLVKPENISVEFKWNKPIQRSFEEILADCDFDDSYVTFVGSNWEIVPLVPKQKQELDKIYDLISSIASNNPENILDGDKIESMVRVLGVWICQKYGHSGMIYVADKNYKFTVFLCNAWDGIGVFMN